MPGPDTGVDRLALLAAEDEATFSLLLSSYKPFIFSQVKKASGKARVDEHDDLASVGMIAFSDAVRTYDSVKGGFLPYAGAVIRNRIIDQLRADGREPSVAFSIEPNSDEGERHGSALDRKAVELYGAAAEAEERRLEIETLRDELDQWGISFALMYADAPKREGGRREIRRAVRHVLDHPECLDYMTKKHLLPIAELEKDLRIPRKKLEKSRRFIVACILIATGDYPMLGEYLGLERSV